MTKENFEKFKNQVWCTRVSRINAEKRLMSKEKFIQFINIYYSVVTVIYSIMSYINCDNKLSEITIYITISLLISILYLNAQNYPQLARAYRENYTNLQNIEFRLKHLSENDEDEIKQIEKEYCTLLNQYSNHITYDYYCAINDSNVEFKKNRDWTTIKCRYQFGKFWRCCLKICFVLLPIFLFCIRGYL